MHGLSEINMAVWSVCSTWTPFGLNSPHKNAASECCFKISEYVQKETLFMSFCLKRAEDAEGDF